MMQMHDIAALATLPAQSRGRKVAEEECHTRNVFQRDRDRIIHSTAFRRLEYKTQVFINHEGDHFRTRLTHSLEVAQLARSMCRALGWNEDIAEAMALAHDLGHTPFGHAGEDALHEVMQPYGGFDHNIQTLRILTSLERRYAAFDGLNLTWEVLEGIAKHNGPVVLRGDAPSGHLLREIDATHALELHHYAGPEAQIAAIADDIAYNNHDLEDGIRARMFELDALRDIPMIAEIIREVDRQHAGIDAKRRVHEVIRRIVSAMVSDVLEQTRAQVAAQHIASRNDVAQAKVALVSFSTEMEATHQALKAFLMQHMYRHYRVNRMTVKARRVVQGLFAFFFDAPECLPGEWYHKALDMAAYERARLVCDFIAGMTDRFALHEYRKLFDV